MIKKDLIRYADQETSWLRYYGSADTRKSDSYNDAKFYDRIISIGYTKRVLELSMRCAAGYITSAKPVLESTLEELEYVSGPRNHEKNIYTPLEYVLSTKFEGYEKFIETLRS